MDTANCQERSEGWFKTQSRDILGMASSIFDDPALTNEQIVSVVTALSARGELRPVGARSAQPHGNRTKLSDLSKWLVKNQNTRAAPQTPS